MIMLAGGPGQASAGDVQPRPEGRVLARFLPRVHARRLRRPRHRQVAARSLPTRATIAACGSAITTRAYYTTPEHGEDIESVRLALGVDKVADLGRLLRHEARRRLRPRAPDPCRAPPARLRGLAGQGHRSTRCRCVTVPASVNADLRQQPVRLESCPGSGDRLVRLANQLAGAPGHGLDRLRPERSRRSRSTLDGQALLSLAYESDLSSAVSSQLPAAVDAALAGWTAAARAPCVPRPGHQLGLGERRQHRPPPDDELRRRAVPVGSRTPHLTCVRPPWTRRSPRSRPAPSARSEAGRCRACCRCLCVSWPSPSGGAVLARAAAGRPGARPRR